MVFKVPEIPALKIASIEPPKHNVTPFQIFEDFSDANLKAIDEQKDVEKEDDEEEEEIDDMSQTIYFQNYEREVKDVTEESDDQQAWEEEQMCSFIADDENRYEYTFIQHEISDERKVMSLKVNNAIERSNGNPFSSELRSLIIDQCKFEKYLNLHVPECVLLKNIPKLKNGVKLEVGSDVFNVHKFIAKGNFGSIHLVENCTTETLMAAKQEKPANLWEYYICMELSDRLRVNHLEHMKKSYMKISYAIIANNASVFITDFSPFGTIIDVCNKIRKVTGRNLDEFIGMHMTSTILSIIDFLHSCHIIHADIKPDNFLIRTK